MKEFEEDFVTIDKQPNTLSDIKDTTDISGGIDSIGDNTIDVDDKENLTVITDVNVDDKENLTGVTDVDVDDKENLTGVTDVDVDDKENLTGVTDVDVDDKENLTGVTDVNVDDKENLTGIAEIDVDDDPIRQVTLEDNYDPTTSTWIHHNVGDPRINNPDLIAHDYIRVSGGGSLIDGRYVSPDVYSNPITAQEELALETFDVKDNNDNVIGQTKNTATELTKGSVFTDGNNNIIGSDGEPTGQKLDPTTVKSEPQGIHPGGGLEVKLDNSDDFVKDQTTINHDIERDISWGQYIAKEHKAETIAKIQEQKDAYYSKRPTPKPSDGDGGADNAMSIGSASTTEEVPTDIDINTEVFGNEGSDPYANNPDSHFSPTDQRHLDPQSEQTEFTNLKAVRELWKNQRD